MKTAQQTFGSHAEQHVAHYLAARGFSILAHNYRTASGEIDLIASKDSVLAFIEVKARSYHFVEPAALVPYTKQQKIIRTAYLFIAKHNLIDKIYRFDIAFLQSAHGTLNIEYVENAFTDQYE